MYQPKKPIATSDQVQEILGEKFESQDKKPDMALLVHVEEAMMKYNDEERLY